MTDNCPACGNRLRGPHIPFCPYCGTRILSSAQKTFASIKKNLINACGAFSFKPTKPDVMLPPAKLRNYVGGDGAFEEIGERFVEHFKKFGHLKPHEAVLDVGCGCGRMARPLTVYLNKGGSYAGFDIDEKSITWCAENISPRYPRFRFEQVDLQNKYYNPAGKINPEHFVFPYASEAFDFVCLISVFTHLLPQHMEQYYAEISRVLKKGGRCLITYFLMNPESVQLINRKESCIDFIEVNDGIYSTDKQVPEQVIAYKEDLIRGLYAKYGLSVKTPFYYGSWCGREENVDFQDMVIARK